MAPFLMPWQACGISVVQGQIRTRNARPYALRKREPPEGETFRKPTEATSSGATRHLLLTGEGFMRGVEDIANLRLAFGKPAVFRLS